MVAPPASVIADAILPACTLQPAPPPTPAPNAPSQVHQLHVHSARARNTSTSVDAMQTHADDTRRRKDKRIEEGRRDGIEMKEERGTRGDETLGTLKQQRRRHMCHVASAYLCAPSTRTTTSFHANATIHDANATIYDADATILDANATIHDTNATIHDTNTTIPSTTPTPTRHTDSPASSVHAQTTPANAGVARMHTEDTRTKREGKEEEREEEGMILSVSRRPDSAPIFCNEDATPDTSHSRATTPPSPISTRSPSTLIVCDTPPAATSASISTRPSFAPCLHSSFLCHPHMFESRQHSLTCAGHMC
ncbi:uncharacterized protein HD556DRAFT_1443914 [Suillus plorans]|uniref:Uncharacterized protein n=1 Tax=Suillus plorans TaxID=116603 RepID=A0A9P7DHK7_9AGAM|nr:uncharacterized protein HD556DRAFT_1443914 [Suillus plorans]KAG1793162.1 hypothetical protein HD556DRAFT_1443914 [Suillus plorans]